MSFEIRERDILGRIGRLETKSGTIETPLLLPVINPSIQLITPEEMQKLFNCTALITNAYIIRKHLQERATERGIHRLLSFNGPIMTDSGAYQTLVYGDVDVSPKEIVQFQERISTDIATILDVPTGWGVSKKHAQHTVSETLRRARDLSRIKSRDDIIWVGPVQGGQYLDLVAHSARELGELPFEISALGSPTPVMERYLFGTLVEMIIATKMNMPLERPLHLFGAGHPLMFVLAVALGCDMFDSAAYAKYAREGRYMKEQGTTRLSELQYFPCSCSVCGKHDPKDVQEMERVERQRLLAAHNLHISFAEIKSIKQAIVEGRLWEHLELRAHGHPSLLQALKSLGKHAKYLEPTSPVRKRSGLHFLDSPGLARPEVTRLRERLAERYSPPENRVLVLLPQTRMKPFHKSAEYQRFLQNTQQRRGSSVDLHVCVYAAPFGIVPAELDEVYPLSQYELAAPLDRETIEDTAKQAADYIMRTNCKGVILLQDAENWRGRIVIACKRACKRKATPLEIVKK